MKKEGLQGKVIEMDKTLSQVKRELNEIKGKLNKFERKVGDLTDKVGNLELKSALYLEKDVELQQDKAKS